jgi:hypothetical protein
MRRGVRARAVELDAMDPFELRVMGRTYRLVGDLDAPALPRTRDRPQPELHAPGIYARSFTETLAGRAVEGRGHVDLAMRLSPLDPLYYAMLGTRAFTHLVEGEGRAAAGWRARGAPPGAHVLTAMIASATQAMAGDEAASRSWAANVRERNPALTRDDFFRSFPIKSAAVRARVSEALARRGF